MSEPITINQALEAAYAKGDKHTEKFRMLAQIAATCIAKSKQEGMPPDKIADEVSKFLYRDLRARCLPAKLLRPLVIIGVVQMGAELEGHCAEITKTE